MLCGFYHNLKKKHKNIPLERPLRRYNDEHDAEWEAMTTAVTEDKHLWWAHTEEVRWGFLEELAFGLSALENEEVADEVQSGREGEGEWVFHEEDTGEQRQDWAEQWSLPFAQKCAQLCTHKICPWQVYKTQAHQINYLPRVIKTEDFSSVQ